MTALEIRLLACLREYRRLDNQTVKNNREVRACHLEADALLELEPASDDRSQRYDAPHRVEHHALVDSMFRR